MKIGFDHDYMLKTSIRNIKTFPILEKIPPFYQSVILSFNKSKTIKPFDKLNTYEILQLPLWGCEYFKVKNACLYLRRWIKKGIYYVKDLVNNNGCIKNDVELYNCTENTCNAFKEVFIVKQYILKRLKIIDVSIAPYVKIKPMSYVVYQNRIVQIHGSKSKLFYGMLLNKIKRRGNMETLYSQEFGFENNVSLWKNVYTQKLNNLSIPKLCEFNFKILHNILPCGNILSKWKNISAKCSYCGEVESIKHMLYDCLRIRNVWENISKLFRMPIGWKHIVCGFPKYSISTKISCYNFIITVIAYSIFKENSRSKFDSLDYAKLNIKKRVRENIVYYRHIMEKLGNELTKCVQLEKLIECMDSLSN